MSAKYFVAVRPRINDYHSVHKEGCPFITDLDKGIYLGLFDSGREAEIVAKKHFSKSGCCPYCLHEKKVHVELKTPEEVVFNVMHYQGKAELTQYENLVCCIN